MLKKRRCTREETGTIIGLKIHGLESPTTVVVQYTTWDPKSHADRTYEIRESLKLRSEAIKLGPIPIGQRSIPVMGNTRVGTKVRVLYDPNDPSKAYLPDNEGHRNV